MDEKKLVKSAHAEREEKILKLWKDKRIFEKSLEKASPKGEFVFYEGPPTANGRPGIHHLEARAFKDVIPRYRTMCGYHVRRKGGWDTHGLPVELQVEKELGLKSKKEIETYGIERFNEKCKQSVWTYVHEWEDFTNRMGFWLDLKNPYVTYRAAYMESIWNIFKHINEQDLLYKDYKVVPWCPRCGTALSSHELAQGYEDVKDLAVTVKFKLKSGQKIGQESLGSGGNVYILSWTTTPWTLPGNVGLAIGSKIDYVQIKVGDDLLLIAKARLGVIKEQHSIEKEFKGKDLVGLEYEAFYPFIKENISGAEKEKLANAFKVYPADFVTTEDGSGVVHIAPMYGQDDFDLGTQVGLPKYHLVNEDGTFKKETGFLSGKSVKAEEVAVEIIKDLAHRGLLHDKEKHQHSYPFCWRCHTPLIYFARDSWYIRMSELRHKLVKENGGINWEPAHIKDGRFGEWLREVKDWAISRERYWGTPLPVWICEKCGKKKVVGSVADVSKKPKNTYYVIRHAEAENNVARILDSEDRDKDHPSHLTEKGKEQVKKTAESLKNQKFDLIFVSPLIRAIETGDILKEKLGWKNEQVIVDDRIREMGMGEWNGKDIGEFYKGCPYEGRFETGAPGGEIYADIKKRMGSFLYELETKFKGKNILIVTHETPAFLLIAAARGLDREQSLNLRGKKDKVRAQDFIANAEVRKVDFTILPHNEEYELDLHRPYIDEVKLLCSCGLEMRRVKEVIDVWFDSGAMPFAQDHYPFENKDQIDGGLFKGAKDYPADFISEAIDQTRGWFYTLHAIGVLMDKGKAFRNVICLGHILDSQGKKMSKSLGNVVDPWKMMDKYGADALRFWMYSINQPGESKNFDEKTVDEVIKKVFNLISNTAVFYKIYTDEKARPTSDSKNILDRWIIARLNQLIENVTVNLDKYVLMEPVRAIRDFAADLSQWYVRRSRDRFKNEGADKQAVLATTKYVLLNLAKIMAPFTPFFAEELYLDVGGSMESVHLENWPATNKVDEKVLKSMNSVRAIASKGLEARMVAKINVRQPLQILKIKAQALEGEFVELIKEEVNIKEVAFDEKIEKDVEIDTNISAGLKEEGDLRELLRKIQDLRKEKGLSIKDKAVFIATNDLKPLMDKHEKQIKTSTNLTDIEYGETLGLK